MNPDYSSCTEFEKAVDYNYMTCYRPEDDRFNTIKGQYQYVYNL